MGSHAFAQTGTARAGRWDANGAIREPRAVAAARRRRRRHLPHRRRGPATTGAAAAALGKFLGTAGPPPAPPPPSLPPVPPASPPLAPIVFPANGVWVVAGSDATGDIVAHGELLFAALVRAHSLERPLGDERRDGRVALVV